MCVRDYICVYVDQYVTVHYVLRMYVYNIYACMYVRDCLYQREKIGCGKAGNDVLRR